ncbi:ABC transporter permease subunit [Romboutsia weinsteinii]|nr:ABC transporter permease subunit [Romboutsia weinsteinii]
MIDLIKLELYKILSKKLIIIMILLAVLFGGINIYANINPKHSGFDSVKEIKKIFEPYEGRVIKEDEVRKISTKIEEIHNKKKKDIELTKEENLYYYHLRDYMIQTDPMYLINGERYRLEDIKDEIKNLESKGKTNTFEYKNLDYIHSIISKREAPKFYYKFLWNISADFNVIATLTSTLVAIGIATIFSEDYQRNSSSIILSSRNGKTKLVTSKILTGVIYTFITFIFMNGIYSLNAAAIGFEGGNLPLSLFNGYEGTPFNITMSEFYLRGLATSFMGLLLYASIIMLISLILKNNMLSLLFGLAIYHVPQYIGNFITGNIGRILREINISEAVRIQSSFQYTNTYNILGNPVLYSTVLTTLVIIVIPVTLFLIKYFGKKQEI